MKSKLKIIAAMLTTGLDRNLVCEACGKEFACGAGLRGCWCSEIQLSDEARADLKSRYRDCLCRECLERLSEPPAVAGG